ncbi:TIGR01777 family protein [Leptobacterium flavescens]|uniref:TIGR01777 family protein n=1 Tax=Leptobacterium flavescens TaxID=472055 RepID=A0A6P0USD4_9FLAO|nr:TIGR01777 family oxidoreductase [Leptobacterium flavescens]NER15452.1 TIGR01777 family protein [Leptobacterium flavescens]
MKVLITGATGLIGSEIVKLSHERGIDVHYLTTSKNKISDKDNYRGFYWDPEKEQIDVSCLEGVDAIINLAGASVAKRWTGPYKEKIRSSRIQSVRTLREAIDQSKNHNIKSFVSASAIGIYPDSLTEYYEVDEKRIDDSFLGRLTSEWEAAVDELSGSDISVAKVRVGLVLSSDGGALSQMVKPIKYYAGAVFGNGEQWQSWIHIRDLAEIFLYITEKKMTGVFNGVAPNPVTHEKLIKEIASQLNRPLFLPNIPRSMLKLVLGEMSSLLFSSQRVSCKRLENFGFHFQYPNIKGALENILSEEKELNYKPL